MIRHPMLLRHPLRSRFARPARRASLCVAIGGAVALAACAPDDAHEAGGGPATLHAPATDSAPGEPASPDGASAPASALRSADSADAAYPPPTPGLRTPVEGLPGELRFEPERALACPRTAEAPRDHALVLLPTISDAGEDLIAIASDRARSVAGWRLSEHLPPGLSASEITGLRARDVWLVDADSGARPPTVAVQARAGDEELLWIVECGYAPRADLPAEAAGPSVIAVLALAVDSPVAGEGRLELRLADWSGDGRQEALAGVGERRVLFAEGSDARWRAVMTLEGAPAVVDLDADGRLEAVAWQPEEGWRIREWSGEAIEETTASWPEADVPVVEADALPAMPRDLYLRQADAAGGATWRWPSGGGLLERVDLADDDILDRWQTLLEAPRRAAGHSREAGLRLVHRPADSTSEVEATADPANIPPGATRAGAIHRLDPAGGADRPVVATYERVHEDYGLETFMGLAVSPVGERLAWSDGAGLWAMALPEGPVQLLAPWARPFSGDADVIEGLHRPVGWSPDGRLLLVEIGYSEGGDYGLWHVAAGRFERIPGSFGYVDGYSEIAWLSSGRLLHARSGGDFGGNASLSSLDPMALDRPTFLHQAWPRLHEMASATVLGFAERPDARVVFGMRSNLPFDAASNGIFELAPDGSLERVADWPVLSPRGDDPFTGGGFRCRLRLAAEGSAFACSGRESGSGEVRLLVGNVDGGLVWDATPLFDAEGIGPIDAVAFGARAQDAD